MFYIKEQRNIIGMLFPDADKYNQMLESIGNFAEKEILPDAKKVDHEGIFPDFKELVKHGVMAIPFPEEYNGSGLPYPVYIAALEMLAKACANTALQVSVQGMVCEGIRLFGNERQRKEFLKERGLVGGRGLAAYALTEPCCGSDARSIKTNARLSGDTYILNGYKILITNPGEADIILVFANTDKGLSSFIVERGTPGFEITRNMPKLGLRGLGLSGIRIKDCRIARENLLGEDGEGFEYAKQMLNIGRMTLAALAVGIAQAAYEKSLMYSKERKAFGNNISSFQLIQEKLANMATEINAARLLTYYTAHLKDKGKDIASEAAQAKLFASEMALRVCDDAIQIYGGYGYIDERDIHRHWRDARFLTIGEGTSEILRGLIAHISLRQT
ncbi:acyl-CoA dehydrogenase [Candidatus Methanoperedens nitroreducens]|uniref:Acyl-CoA dehydrogenase n=1 Tax=Candidatus Methanoperedens nitratireducens TaxID=1392998 RepID=A0A062UUD7_9EURY|nr:acyl-CoA dehydrogenase family protein [Candidatus Methanoperedens nitroreducens]KCZ70646.1 acyl-CoA dehydrogenase [Candidatus Methanoperedens nitroreducens]MDJ1420499.1 acyl-CoA dehydrogenase family protein [Candidatus Methanoperedens sp.]